MTILVTGATGHVGANMVRELLRRGLAVRVLVRDRGAADPPRALAGLDVEQVRGDVTDRASITRAMAGVATVYHLAAMISILGDKRGAVGATNIEGARNVARAAREAGVARMVHMSSCHAFDLDWGPAAIHEQAPRPKRRDPYYNRSKAAGEAAVREEIAAGLDAVIVNPTGVIGPNDFGPSRMGRLFLAFARGQVPAGIDGGFDFVDVRDLVATTIAAGERGRTGENYLVGGSYVRVPQLLGIAATVLGTRKAPRLACPMWLARLGGPPLDLFGTLTGIEPLFTSESLHALRAGKIDSSRAKAELGHAPRPLTETIRDVYRDFERDGRLGRRAAY
jgi:dihydroflavonol-4-reductase